MAITTPPPLVRPVLSVPEQVEHALPTFLEAMGIENSSGLAAQDYSDALSRAFTALREQEAAIREEQTVHITPPQYRVLEQLARGLTYEEITQELDISEVALKNFVHKVYKALGVKKRRQAEIMFTKGLVFERPPQGGHINRPY